MIFAIGGVPPFKGGFPGKVLVSKVHCKMAIILDLSVNDYY